MFNLALALNLPCPGDRPGNQISRWVVVTDHNDHQEWVYTHAGIDASAVVWARAMNPGSDTSLRRYFAPRRAWILDADANPPRLSPSPESAATASPAPAP